jgi:lysosomal acid lipase/cholesteryl ester hydrolase
VLIKDRSILLLADATQAQPIIRFFYNRSKSLFNRLSSQSSIQARAKLRGISHPIAAASDFTEICAVFGYDAEEHVVHTADGYLLGIHRLPCKRSEVRDGVLVNAGPGSVSKPVVYLHHGLMMNSEVWVCLTEEERCLPFALVEQGYDVWLGNNRGNKYSKKSTRFSPAAADFWNFSIDQFALHDIPDSIDYILGTTGQFSLSYIGFSQGTAQAFATLSIHPPLNKRINLFIALAPAMSPAGLSNGIVDSLIKASPDVLFLAFGRKSLLSSTAFWQSILYQPIFVRVIDTCLSFLFNWTCQNISPHQKLAAYPHLYSFTSTKSVVHWFQIIRNSSFQMYDDDSSQAFSIGASDRYYKVAKFPTRNIKTPILLVYGGCDPLVDIKLMLRELPRHTISVEIKHFEHLDFLWAQGVDKLVFPHVFRALEKYSHVGVKTSNGLSKTLRASAWMDSGNPKWSDSSFIDEDRNFSDLGGETDAYASPENHKSAAQRLRDIQYISKPGEPVVAPGSPVSTWDLSRPSTRKAAPHITSQRDQASIPPADTTRTTDEANRPTPPTRSRTTSISSQDTASNTGGSSGSAVSIVKVGNRGISLGRSRPSLSVAATRGSQAGENNRNPSNSHSANPPDRDEEKKASNKKRRGLLGG